MRPGDRYEPLASTSGGTLPRSEWPSLRLGCLSETGTADMQLGGRSDTRRAQADCTLEVCTPGLEPRITRHQAGGVGHP
jgi:hypothetical protein